MEEKRCIFCFLSDRNQKKMQKYSQIQEEKYEDILIIFKKLFINDFLMCLSENHKLCEKHLKIRYINIIIENFKKIEIEEIDNFFEKLIEVYKNWISGKALVAMQSLHQLLTDKNILNKEEVFNLRNMLFFRGRENFGIPYNRYDMFHIPYDKRYLVKNQRFSLSGYPLLYLNCSIKGVSHELEIENNQDKFVFSYFHFKNVEPEIENSIYSFTNPFKIFFNDKNKFMNMTEEKTYINSYKMENLKIKILKLILSSFCLFEKRVQHKKQEEEGKSIFFEEYVIPQIFTQILKVNDFYGIFYPSTRINEFTQSSLYDENNFNLVYFPTYNSERHYDYNLFKNLDISTPINYEILNYKITPTLKDYDKLSYTFSQKKGNKNRIFFELLMIYLDESNRRKFYVENNNGNEIELERILTYNFLQKSILNF